MEAPERMGTLRALTESEVRLTDLREDLRTREVRDSAGEKIGTIEQLLVDDEKQARLLLVGISDFAGVENENRQVLIPVDEITRITDAKVYIRRTRRCVAGAPLYDSSRVNQRYFESVYAYFGYYPYWAPGYVFPSYEAHGAG